MEKKLYCLFFVPSHELIVGFLFDFSPLRLLISVRGQQKTPSEKEYTEEQIEKTPAGPNLLLRPDSKTGRQASNQATNQPTLVSIYSLD